MATRVKRVIGYCRVSSERQAESGLSIEAQREQIVSFAIASGLELVSVEIDAGVSGAKDETERAALKEVLSAVTEGRVDAVVVCKRDRLSRDVQLAGYLSTLIERSGAELIVLDETDASPLTRIVMLMVSQIERELARARTKVAMRTLREQGRHCGVVPFGYQIIDGRLQPRPGEMEIVQKIITLRSEGKTLSEIATFMTTSNVPTRRGGRWSPEQIRSVLQRAGAAERGKSCPPAIECTYTV